MRLLPLLIFVCLLRIGTTIAQDNAVEGYLVTTSKDTITAYFSPIKQKNTPQEFEYTTSTHPSSMSTAAGKVSEVVLSSGKCYVSTVIEVDKFFSKDIGKIGSSRAIVTQSEKLFIEIIADGDVTIAKFVNGDLERFYYKNSFGKFVMLEHNQYNYKGKIMTNDTYRFQLKEILKEANLPAEKFSKLTYTQSSILKLIKAYHEKLELPLIFLDLKDKPKAKISDILSMQIRPGVRLNSLEIDKSGMPVEDDIDFGSQLGFRLGAAFELTPYGNKKTTLLFEPTFQYFTASQTLQEVEMFAKHYTIELAFGVRYYFWNNETSRMFTNLSFIYDAPISSDVNLDVIRRTPKTSLESSIGFNAGIGYKINEKYSLEFNYSFPRNIVNEFFTPTSTYQGFSLIFGYTIF